MSRLTRLAVLLLVAASAAGCASEPVAPSDFVLTAPDDFSIDVTVLADPTRAPKQPAPRNLRMILYADGALHFGEDARMGAGWVPERIRTLSRRQVDELWRFSRSLDLTTPEAADPLIDLDAVKAERGEERFLVAMTGAGTRWNFVRSSPTGSESDPALDALVVRLSELAWAEEEERRPVAPKRYDFGPDPYERYR